MPAIRRELKTFDIPRALFSNSGHAIPDHQATAMTERQQAHYNNCRWFCFRDLLNFHL
jgi:hypothetical protein